MTRNSWNGSEFSRLGDAREIMAVFTFVVPRGLPADLHRAGDRLRPFVRLLRPRSDSPLRGQRFHRFYRRLTALRHDNPALAAGSGAAR